MLYCQPVKYFFIANSHLSKAKEYLHTFIYFIFAINLLFMNSLLGYVCVLTLLTYSTYAYLNH